ncbi:MAG TPA: HAMP domain-containing protein [Candidatus Kapabacteria bacterium]|nr:HAMP domain-containing protein [Candidatus Kapabacteria bacterium]
MAAGSQNGKSTRTGGIDHLESASARKLLSTLVAVRKGDFSARFQVDETLAVTDSLTYRIAQELNDIIEMNQNLVRELERTSNVVGKEGKITQRATLPNASGAWAVAVEGVNTLIFDLAQPLTEVARVIGGVAKGDLSQTMSLEIDGRPLKGEFLRTGKVVNTMVEQLSSFASEVTRVAREVGTEGKLGGQAVVKGVSGTWKDLTDNVNFMASNLTAQVRSIANVTTAVANGDLSKKITVDVKGEIQELKNTINTMVDQLSSFAAEVTRVAREVGTEGKLGGQAQVKGVSGTWKDLTDNVNFMASNLTAQVRNIANVTTAVANGDLSKKITVDVKGEILELKNTINTMVDQLNSFASEVTRVAREVGTEGKLGGQAVVKGVSGTWKDLTDNVNFMASNLTGQVRNIADVTTAVATGDLSKKITVDVKGEILELKNTINTMVDQLSSFAAEVTRVAREVGTEGKLGGQADVKGVAGVWKGLTDNVNFMASNLTGQVRNIAEVTTAVATGDLSKKITVDVKGEILELKNTINTMVDQLSSFAAEVTRVAREVGTEGKLGGQAEVKGVAGTWKDLTDNVNFMAANLTSQVRNIAEVTTAVANGDLSKKITVDVQGEISELKNTINTMVDQLNSFASEVTRVAREVGTEGKLGGQADVKGVSGTWKDLTDNVNFMASNLTGQVRNIANVTTAVANGDLSQKITVDVKGEILELKNTINKMVDSLGSFASEVTRVAREVGTDGKLGGQAEVRGVAGVWKDLTDNVNSMAGNLTSQVRNIADVTTAVATGDLSKKITVDVKGEILELKNTINTMVDQLSSFAAEVTRVAREVGTEGKLGGQAQVKGVSGTWKDLTDSVNFMASNLTAQVRNIANVTTAVANGDLSKKVTVDVKGEILELKNTVNTMVDQLNSFASEVTRVAREVGTDGKLGGQADVKGVSGTWKDLTDNVNFMASNLTGQVRNIANVTTAVANGDLSKKITVDVKGEILELKDTINTMVDQLNSFASEVTRVAREVGTEGKLGGQADVKGVAGVWKELTDNVNFMAANLTTQVRGIARVVTAVANGNLKRKLTVEAMGEIAELADTINAMIDTLATFADQVTTVAREVGIEGKLGGQASVPGASGTWRDLTDNVNRLAANLTSQVRAMAEVATAVTKGDLSRMITVEAAGEVAYLKDNVNEMIRNLKDTTRKNTEQDWLKTNLARFTRLLQGQKDLWTVSRLILSELAPLVNMQHGVFYITEGSGSDAFLKLLASYAYRERKNLSNQFKMGEGLVGQCALEKERIVITGVPNDYIKVNSGLGESAPLNIVVLPVLFEGQVKAVIELASFHPFNEIHVAFLDQLTESIGIVLNTIEANMRTESLLAQSQSLTQELQTQQQELTETNRRLEQQAKSLQASEELLKKQQEELQETNEELQDKAKLLGEQKNEVERKNREIELARGAIEEKAEQLALTSKYKSEFLANMSHELRTPLNSMLILSKMLSENNETNLTNKQVEFAETIYSSGADLLALINEILDLSKIESGTMAVDIGEMRVGDLQEDMHRIFDSLAQEKALAFEVQKAEGVPETIATDSKRLEQVLKNLLSNAFKFTHQGKVKLEIAPAPKDIFFGNELLNKASNVIAFSVIDTGIGIAPEKHKVIFEAFQQADGTTSREYGGTGLGLSISREIARLLGGEIRLQSKPGEGSTFTLYIPASYIPTTIGLNEPSENGTAMNGSNGVAPFGQVGSVQSRPLRPTHPRETNFEEAATEPNEAPATDEIPDDRDSIQPGDRTLLVIEDDPNFAKILLDMAHEKDFKVIAASRGETGLAYARRYKPDAISLDVQLPGIHGLAVLDRLKHDPATRHIPVQIVSVIDQLPRQKRMGAVAQIQKPASPEVVKKSIEEMRRFTEQQKKRLLVVENNEEERKAIAEFLDGEGDIELVMLSSGKEAMEKLQSEKFDCIVVDLVMPDRNGFEFIENIRKDPKYTDLPIIVYTGKELTKKESAQLAKLTESVITKDMGSIDKLLDETSLFLHQNEAKLSDEKRRRLENVHSTDAALSNKKVLIVDDDIRNIFAVSSFLERHNMRIVYAENGQDALDLINKSTDIDVVLMDIMMPGMDGYEAMRAIRKNRRYKHVPMIAVTAKAMRGDREKCIEAGASDYITKPVDVDQLLSLLRVWLFK